MSKLPTLTLMALALAGTGLAYAGLAAQPEADAAYTCPATGDPLPCPACCPLN